MVHGCYIAKAQKYDAVALKWLRVYPEILAVDYLNKKTPMDHYIYIHTQGVRFEKRLMIALHSPFTIFHNHSRNQCTIFDGFVIKRLNNALISRQTLS